MNMLTVITHLVAILIGFVAGWLGKTKFGPTVQKIETDIRAPKS